MKSDYTDIKTINDLHLFYGVAPPKHPLISIVDLKKVDRTHLAKTEKHYRLGFYSIFFKTLKGSLTYGRAQYDFDEGTLMFTAPYQLISVSPDVAYDVGWGLFFHPDLVNGAELGKKINTYSFFHYEANEALHTSEDEKKLIKECVENIKREYSQNIDKHTRQLIQSNLELLLGYCDRFYDRQFFTRAKVNNDVVQRFEKILKDYFAKDTLIDMGLPDVKFFASKLNLSPNYLSDLLNRHTGKTTQEHIHLQLVDRAKSLLWESKKTISEIAYDLGF